MAVDNNTILGKVWLAGTNDFQQRIPNPDQSNMQAFMDALFDPMNRNYYNQFCDILVNRIGRTIVRGKRWENKLRAFKQDNLRYGNTIQEIAPKWIKAHSYADDDQTLLKLNRPEAAAWYHSVNRQDRYDISINEIELRRAFTEEYGLNEFIAKVLEVPYNSDSYDEYIAMKQLLAFYENTWGFFKINTQFPVDEATGKAFLTSVRTMAEKLPFPSTLYNAQTVDMDVPVFANQDELVLITTPEVIASVDVNTLSAVFQLDKADLKYRIVIIDEFPFGDDSNGDVPIALLTTKDWFVVHDVVYTTASFWNPQTLSTNYYLHHHSVISCSPFVPAILFTTGIGSFINAITQSVTGVSITPATATVALGGTQQLTVALTGTITANASGIVVAPDAVTWEVYGNNALNSRTYVDRFGVLHVQKSGIASAQTFTVKGTTTYLTPDGTVTHYNDTVTITIA